MEPLPITTMGIYVSTNAYHRILVPVTQGAPALVCRLATRQRSGSSTQCKRNGKNWRVSTGSQDATKPSHHSIRTEHSGDTLVGWPQHRLLGKDEMGRHGTMEQSSSRVPSPWTHPHDNPRPSRDTIRMILTPRHATAAWLFAVIPRSHLQMTSIAGHGHGRTQDGHMATLLTTPAVGRCRHLHSSPGQDAYCRFSTPGNCQPPPAHGRSGERNGDIQAHSVAEPAWMSHRDPAQQPAVASVPDNTGIPRATSEQYSHSVCTSTAYSHSTP